MSFMKAPLTSEPTFNHEDAIAIGNENRPVNLIHVGEHFDGLCGTFLGGQQKSSIFWPEKLTLRRPSKSSTDNTLQMNMNNSLVNALNNAIDKHGFRVSPRLSLGDRLARYTQLYY